MAENKKTFIFYSDWINMVREMPNEEAGMLLKHILAYVNDENPTSDNLLVKMAFGHMKPMLKADLEKWEGIRKKRSAIGRKGGKANAKQMEAIAKQVEAVNVNDNVNVNVNDNENKEINSYPTINEFVSYAQQKASTLQITLDIQKVKTKYLAWSDNDWYTSGDKPRKIKNWKTTLTNSLQYMKGKPKSFVIDQHLGQSY